MTDRSSAVAAGWTLFFGFIGGIVALWRYPQNSFVRFYAFQSIYLSLVNLVPVPGLSIIVAIYWVWAMVGAFQGKLVVLPIIGKIALDNSAVHDDSGYQSLSLGDFDTRVPGYEALEDRPSISPGSRSATVSRAEMAHTLGGSHSVARHTPLLGGESVKINGESWGIRETRSDGSMKVSRGSIFEGGVETKIVERDGSVRSPSWFD